MKQNTFIITIGTIILLPIILLFSCGNSKIVSQQQIRSILDDVLFLKVNNGITEDLNIQISYLSTPPSPSQSEENGVYTLQDKENINKITITKSGFKQITISDFVNIKLLKQLDIKMYPNTQEIFENRVKGKVRGKPSSEGKQGFIVAANINNHTESVRITDQSGSYEINDVRKNGNFFEIKYIFKKTGDDLKEISFKITSNNPEEEITIYVDDNIIYIKD